MRPDPTAPKRRRPRTAPAKRKKPRSASRQATLALGEIVGPCPKCGSDVLDHESAYVCQRAGCRFKVNRVILDQVIEPTQVSKLLHDGRTDLLSGFVSKKGQAFSAFLVIDEAGKITLEFPRTPPHRPAKAPPTQISLLRGTVPARIIILDDEPFVADAIKLILQQHFKDFTVAQCGSGDEAWTEICTDTPDLLITDYNHPGLSLEDMLRRLSRKGSGFPIIIASAYASAVPGLCERLQSSSNLTINLLSKPFSPAELRATVQECLSSAPASTSNPETAPRTEETPSSGHSERPHSSECKPILDAATKDLFRRNAFRVTGLPVDATTRELVHHADKLKILAELGQDNHSQTAAYPMKPPPSLDEIRAAIQRLNDPEQRLIHEFFWFWPEQFGQRSTDPAIQALQAGDSDTALRIVLNNGPLTSNIRADL